MSSEISSIKEEAYALAASVSQWEKSVRVTSGIALVAIVVGFIVQSVWGTMPGFNPSLIIILVALIVSSIILSHIRSEIATEYLAREVASLRPQVAGSMPPAQPAANSVQEAPAAAEKPAPKVEDIIPAKSTAPVDTRQMPAIPESEKTSSFFAPKAGVKK